MIDLNSLVFGLLIIILNLIPIILGRNDYFKITIPLSLLIGAIKVLFLS